MKNIFVTSSAAIAVSLLLSTQTLAAPATSEEKSNELVGLGSGVLVGTAIAGPLGGMIAGIFGLLIADDVNSDKKLVATSALISQKEQELMAMQQRYNEADIRANILMATLDKTLEQSTAELSTNIQFKTASSQLEQHYQNELDLLATTLRNNPKLAVRLSGFADQRGDSNYNQTLSEQRTLTVKNYLLEQGVVESQLLTQSYGESQLVSSGLEVEDNFFDRRVNIQVSDKVSAMTAANP